MILESLWKDSLKIRNIDEFVSVIDRDDSKGIRVPVKIYANKQLLSKIIMDRTIDQAINVTALPGVVKHVIVLPDGHEGYGFPVGGVAAVDANEPNGVISPGGVGYDINCGVRLIRTDLTEDEVRPKIKELVNELFSAIPSGLGSRGKISLTAAELDEILVEGVKWAIKGGYGRTQDLETCEENGYIKDSSPLNVSEIAKKRGLSQIGSLGSGNHFLEIQKVERIFDDKAAKAMGITKEGQVTVLVHCGSRGLGHQICSDYLRVAGAALRKYNIAIPDRELACVPNSSIEGKNYRGAMACALNFAWVNRQMIMHWTRQTFEKVFHTSNESEPLNMTLVYDVAHNIAKTERHNVNGEGKRNLVVHRKGATRAFPPGAEEIPQKYRNIGQPVIIPGSMGTASWILVGGSRSMDLSFGSTAHGAGRVMSRSEARRSYSPEMINSMLGAKGIYIKALTRDGVVEEAPAAYKDVDMVVDVSHNLGIATRVARLVPLGVIKG
ncbi:MAG: RtcB family protein [Candidatus Eiseniibacteriota bacterium]